MSLLLNYYTLVEVIHLMIRFNKTTSFLRNTKNTDRMGKNRQNTHTPHTERKVSLKRPLFLEKFRKLKPPPFINYSFTTIATPSFHINHSVPPFYWVGGNEVLKNLSLGDDYFFSQRGRRLHFWGSICLGGPVIFTQHFVFVVLWSSVREYQIIIKIP